MSTAVTLCVFRIEICDGFPLLDHLNFTAPKYLRSMAAEEKQCNNIASSSKDTQMLVRKVRGRREMQEITIETYENKSQDPIENDETEKDSNVHGIDIKNDNSKKSTTGDTSDSSVFPIKSCEKGSDSETISEACDQRSAEISKQRLPETLGFISGNPFVEITKGVLHLYKENELTSIESGVERSEMVCMLAVPASVTCHDLLLFTAACQADMQHLRIIRDSTPNQYMALVKFRSQEAADEFYRSFNGVPFNSMEENVCNLAYVSRVETLHEDAGDSVLWPPPHHTELPTCPVCLERMDESVDGILTILCNHSFHGSCLSKWGDYTCPVCRFVQTPEMAADSRCFECQSSESLWICLICGHVGCGRYVQGHAYKHFLETQHCYSMQLGSNRVWDYVGDNFVHRLLQNKADGKLVEVGDGRGSGEVVGGGRYSDGGREVGCGCDGLCGSGNNCEMSECSTTGKCHHHGSSDEKLDSLQLEFTYLLTSQLESQRLYFEEAMSRLEKKSELEQSELKEKAKRVTEENYTLQSKLAATLREKQAQERKVQQLSAKLNAIQTELQEEKQMSKGMQHNQSIWHEKFISLEKKFEEQQKEKEKEIQSLKEQLRDIMFYLEAQNQIAQSPDRDDIAGGEVVVGAGALSSPSEVTSKGKHRRRKGR
ncbi:BRCA1-associated protein [Ischnura elegans]|uniref:BRCA1-associated protein n=1 Tax=Ischnura elegans TaxID=197161 RepID=UPI001ED88A74|nr:BRCA1-associated protein [Ischnura elegans]